LTVGSGIIDARKGSKTRRPITSTAAEEMARQGIDAAACSLQIFGAEPWGESMRSELERRLGLAALDIYGIS
jgi:phenylacetate-coenzyme A ligase PaaK-like adenylate-forming protein